MNWGDGKVEIINYKLASGEQAVGSIFSEE
jgi:hypothetical protein